VIARRAAASGALALAMSLLPVAAGAQATGPTQLKLVSQQLVIAPEQPLVATLAIDGAVPDGATLSVTVSARLRHPREGLHALLDEGGSKGGTVDFISLSLDEVPRDTAGRLSLNLSTVRRSRNDTRQTLRLSAAGLYPITFELRTAEDDPIASLLTFVERTDDREPIVPMSVAVVASITSEPATQPDGTQRIDDQARANLEQVAAVLEHNKVVPTTLSLPPELLDALAASAAAPDQAIMQKLTALLPGHDVLSRPYVTMDPSSAAKSGLAPDYTRLLAQGEDTLQRLFPGVTPDRTMYLGTGSLEADGLQLLRDLGTLNVVLGPPRADDEGDPRTKVDPTRTTQLTGQNSGAVRATVLDDALLNRITADADPVLAAHYAAVELIALQAEDDQATGRGLVVLPPAGWPMSAVFLGTLEDLLASIPVLRPVSLAGLFAAVSPTLDSDGTTPLAIPPPGGPVTDEHDLADALSHQRLEIQRVSSMLPSADPMPADLRQLLDLSLAEDAPPEQRTGYLNTVDGQLQAVTSSIVPTERRQFTITSRRTTIPITIRSTWPQPLKVKLRLTSQKLNFPEGDQIITVDQSSPPFRVPVEAKTNGTFQVTAYVLTPDGDALLGSPTSITVRSTALSGLGILVTIGAGLVLAAWWLQHFRRRRRGRSTADSASRHPTAPIDRGNLPAT
jgi:Family of unknown function (DUF6049)